MASHCEEYDNPRDGRMVYDFGVRARCLCYSDGYETEPSVGVLRR